jgi:hypothetical protein
MDNMYSVFHKLNSWLIDNNISVKFGLIWPSPVGILSGKRDGNVKCLQTMT